LEDFDALASSLALGLGEVRGCLILSLDGLVPDSSSVDAAGFNQNIVYIREVAD
jgi:hypothetical protein